MCYWFERLNQLIKIPKMANSSASFENGKDCQIGVARSNF